MNAPNPTPEPGPLDLSEKGMRRGEQISLNRRLFMKFTAFGNCLDPHAAASALEDAGITGVLYIDANDPRGIGIMVPSEDPDYFVAQLREVFNRAPFDELEHKSEFDMLGRTYSIGYEPDLEDTLFTKPREKLLNPAFEWAVWYPLQRSKKFQVLPEDHQRRILAEHGTLAKRYGLGGSPAMGSTRTTTISSSACSARSSSRSRPSSRRCARPSRRRSTSTASGRFSSARFSGGVPLERVRQPRRRQVR